jgi:hypothetical protein
VDEGPSSWWLRKERWIVVAMIIAAEAFFWFLLLNGRRDTTTHGERISFGVAVSLLIPLIVLIRWWHSRRP